MCFPEFNFLARNNINGIFPKFRNYEHPLFARNLTLNIKIKDYSYLVIGFFPSWYICIQMWEPVESWLFQIKPVSFPTKKGDSSRFSFLPKLSLTFPMAQFSTGYCTKSTSRLKMSIFLREKRGKDPSKPRHCKSKGIKC
jgi:hypothetical protein